MTEENLIDIIRDCINKDDYSTLTSRASFEERYNFFFNGKLINNKGINVFTFFGSKGLFKNLFTESEAKRLIDSFLDVKSRYIIILNLSDEEKIKYIKEISENLNYVLGDYPYEQTITASKFFSSFKDKELMSKAFYENYELFSTINDFEILRFLENISENYKMKLFNKIVEDQLNDKKRVIENYNITNIINCFPEEQKEEVLDTLITIPKYIKKEDVTDNNKSSDNLMSILASIDSMMYNTNDKSNDVSTDEKIEGIVDNYSITEILDCFSYENKKHILEKLYKYFKEKDPNAWMYTSEIFKKFKIEDLKDIIKLFINNYNSDLGIYSYKTDIKDLCIDYNSTLSIIKMSFELEKETNIKLFSGYTLYILIEKLTFEEKLEIFKTYIIEKQEININEFIVNITDIDFKYSVLENLIENNYLEDKTFEIINSHIQERNRDEFADGKINYPLINKLYCEKYNLNIENFSKIVKKYGYIIINFLDNKNIIDTINLPKEDFIKYMEIFDNDKLTAEDINSVCNSMLQREFRLTNQEDYNIFSTIERIIHFKNSNYEEELINILGKINEVVDIQKYLDKYEITKNEFIELLLINNTNSINILHDITNKYIAAKREIYVNERLLNISKELYLEQKIEKQFYKRIYINQISETNIMYDIRYKINTNELDENQKALLENRELLSKLIKFKKSPSSITLTKEEKVSLKVFETILNILYEKQVRSNELVKENTKYSYHIFEATNEQILNIMANINIDNLQKNVLISDELYKNLLDVMKKYHFIGWHKTFTDLARKADIDLSDGTIAGLISYFNEIYPKLNTNSNYLTSLLDYGNLYDYASMRYKYLLGNEDFALIAANEGKNKASMTKHKRLEESVEFVKKMYKRQYTTIPSLDEDFTISNGKKINVVVGNSTNMINLTYGERTEACLRIGGAFADLFDFCISDENGFHIRFTNPNTGKFVSRVSGIRNGNTLFLNELRESVDVEYNNEELIEALKEVASKLINESKKSQFPIENVIITSDYALKEHEKEEQKLYLNNDKSVLYNLPFNIKLSNDSGIILKTDSEDNTLKPYRFSRDNVPKYRCQRDEVNILYNNAANNRIIQLHIINELLSGKELENINIGEIIKCDFCISGEDWYIAKTLDNKIVKYIMPNSKNKDVAEEELNKYYVNMQNYHNKESNIGRSR